MVFICRKTNIVLFVKNLITSPLMKAEVLPETLGLLSICFLYIYFLTRETFYLSRPYYSGLFLILFFVYNTRLRLGPTVNKEKNSANVATVAEVPRDSTGEKKTFLLYPNFVSAHVITPQREPIKILLSDISS